MGYWKDRLIAQDEQGWTYSEKAICPRCVKEPYLKSLIRNALTGKVCDFCVDGRRPGGAAPFDVLMEAVAETISQYYRRAVNHLPYETAEGGYVGSTYDTWDVVGNFSEISDNQDVLDEIVECFGHDVWCDENPFGFSGADRFDASWSDFCRTVKHRTRYFFGDTSAAGERIASNDELTPVPEVLAEIAGIIQSAGREAALPVNSFSCAAARVIPGL